MVLGYCLEFPAEYPIWKTEIGFPKTRVKGEFVRNCSQSCDSQVSAIRLTAVRDLAEVRLVVWDLGYTRAGVSPSKYPKAYSYGVT